MDLGLTDRVVIVTGSSRGIGRATARALAGEGARVVLNARGGERLEEVAAALRETGARVHPVAADVTTEAGCQDLVNQTIAEFGPVDVLVNNVGGGGASSLGSPDEEWAEALNLNFWPALRLTRLVAESMRARRRGVVLMISSLFGRELGGRPGYQVAKSAEISLVKTLAQELAPDNVRVLSVAPGSTLFEGGSWWRRQQADPESIAEMVRRELPLGRFGRPEEIADVVTFLCSERASYMTGACVAVDGCQGRSLV